MLESEGWKKTGLTALPEVLFADQLFKNIKIAHIRGLMTTLRKIMVYLLMFQLTILLHFMRPLSEAGYKNR